MGRAGEHERAAGYFQQALELRPGSAVNHSYLGLERYQAGDLDGAIAAFRRSVELDPDAPDLWSSLGAAYLAAGRNPEASAAFERSLMIRPSAAVLSNYAELKQQQGDYPAAVTLLRRALELEPGRPLIWGNLGDALQGDPVTVPQAADAYAEAARLALEYLAIRSDDASMSAAAGWYLANSGRQAEALAMVARSEELGAGRAEVGMFNAQTLAVLGDRAGARRWIGIARESGVPESRIRALPRLVDVLDETGAPPGPDPEAARPGPATTGG